MKLTLEVEVGTTLTFVALGKGEVFYYQGELFIKRTNTIGVRLTDYRREVKFHSWTRVEEVRTNILTSKKDK